MEGFAGKKGAVSALVVGLLAVSLHAKAGDLSLPVNGSLLGTVEDAQGVPQMGATVQLYNKFERLIAKMETGSDGRFGFASLPPDSYAVRVSLSSYLPVSRDRIAVRPGVNSLLRVHLASLLSNMEVTYAIPTAAMSDDWRWVLRTSPATRAITRLLADQISTSASSSPFPRIFSGTRAMVSVSGGDASLIDTDSGQGDMGTGFALSTNFLGKNLLQLGGNYAQTTAAGPNAVGLVAIYSRDPNSGRQDSPEITFGVSQFGLVGGPALPSSAAPSTSSTPGPGALGGSNLTVRAMLVGIYQTMDPTDDVHFEYGMTGESVDSAQHVSRASPFARLTISAGKGGKVIASYSDGGRPDELTAHQPGRQQFQPEDGGDDLANVANSLTRVPQMSYSDNRMVLQRTLSYELGYQKITGSRTYALSLFSESTANGRVNVAGDTSVLSTDSLLSDGVSNTMIYDIGSYKRTGALASVTQTVGDFLQFAGAYGRIGGFTTATTFEPQTALLDEGPRDIADVRVSAKLPRCGTKLRANYGWVENGALVPTHVFTTQNMDLMPGLNFLIRQPLPSLFGMPGHLELTADVRNILAQGYLPIAGGGGRNLLIVQSPRALRGGLNFIF